MSNANAKLLEYLGRSPDTKVDLDFLNSVERSLPASFHTTYTLRLLEETYQGGTLEQGLPIGSLNAATGFFMATATVEQRVSALLQLFCANEASKPGPQWLSNWYASRLHAVTGPKVPDKEHVQAVCGAYVYGAPRNAVARRKLARGVPRCAHCEKIISGS